jgi:hypothetical protein
MACNFCVLDVTGVSSPSTFTFSDCNSNSITIPLTLGYVYYLNTDSVLSAPADCSLVCTDIGITQNDVVDCCGTIGGKMYYGALLSPPIVRTVESIYFSNGFVLSKLSPFCIKGTSDLTSSYPDISAIRISEFQGNVCSECTAEYPCDTDYYISCCDDCPVIEFPSKSCFFGVQSGGLGVAGTYVVDISDTPISEVCYTYLDSPLQSGYNMFDVSIYQPENVNIAYFYEDCNTCLESYNCNVTPSPTPTPTPTPEPTPKFVDLVNECDVITIFPMSVSCVVTNPSPEGVDGVASLIITGGTPPYTIIWDNGNISPVIYHLPAGSYGATVTDYYSDFTSRTICVLTGSTPTPSATPTPTPTTPYIEYTLCMQITLLINGKYQTNYTTFIPDGIFNSKPSWINGANTRKIIWDNSVSPNRWLLSSSTVTTVTIFNTNPIYPPTSGGWSVVGATGSVVVSEGACENSPVTSEMKTIVPINPTPFTVNISKNDPVCGCDGSISIIPQGGETPFSYSIDSGLTYKKFPIFNNLCSGVYSIKVIDDLGTEVTTTTNLPLPNSPKTYNVSLKTTNKTTSVGSLFKTIEYETVVSVFPELPDGVTITFTLNHLNISKSSPSMTSSTTSVSSLLEIDSFNVPPNDTVIGTGSTSSTLAGCQSSSVFLDTITKTWIDVQYTSQTELKLTTSTMVQKNEDNDCYIGTSENIFQISNASINGCYCCNVTTT